MTALVNSFSTDILAGKDVGLSIDASKDVEFARKKLYLPTLGWFLKKRVRHFYILDVNDDRPHELSRKGEYKGREKSAINLPATIPNVEKMSRIFKALADECSILEIKILECVDGSAVILYSIEILAQPRRH